ncbi:hypothetical protein GCM10008904_23970 [Paraclostridium ghonii]|uniref:EVE domain-containing protein n=1 Tax=Paraclostridium ghonii TaxID=29358 RepID=A0ABU0MZV0_9FIRM|nr:hypothetical protein [Paeniclostridium ghonii]MDQ0556254.1 hypothetical protein [Paeniclostridium ghonii]
MSKNKFIFICNNNDWEFFKNIKENKDDTVSWRCTKDVKKGDEFYIHLGGKSIAEKGIIAKGIVESDSYISEEEDRLRVDLKIDEVFEKPVIIFKQGMYQVQGSCGKVRDEIVDKIENNIKEYSRQHIKGGEGN